MMLLEASADLSARSVNQFLVFVPLFIFVLLACRGVVRLGVDTRFLRVGNCLNMVAAAGPTGFLRTSVSPRVV